MGAKPFYIRSSFEPGDFQRCDKCFLPIKEVQEGVMYYNPNRAAMYRQICSNCYQVWDHKRTERARKYREEYLALQEKETSHGGTNDPIQETNH